MKKIAIFNDFQLPVPAVRGGAVQQLTTLLIEENEKNPKYCFEVFSPFDKRAKEQSKKYKYTKVIFSKWAKLIRFYTNVCFKLKLPVDLSSLPLPYDVLRHFKKQKYDAIYVSGYIRGVLSVTKATGGKTPVYYQHHVCTDILKEPSINGEKTFKECEKLAFVSKYCCDEAKTGIEEYDKKITLFKNCVDTEKYRCADKELAREEIRNKYNIKKEDIVFIFVGRMVANKGCLQLIRAFNLAQAEIDVPMKLLVVGGNTYASNKQSEFVSSCIKEASDNVIFTGYIDNSKIADYFASSDVACIPSVCEEACGLTCLESMSAGLPIITTDAAGIVDYVPDSCKLVSPWKVGDSADNIIEGFKKAIITYAQSEELRKTNGENAAKAVKAFDCSKYMDFFECFIEK